MSRVRLYAMHISSWPYPVPRSPGLRVLLAERHFRVAGSLVSESEFVLTCPMPTRHTVVNPGHQNAVIHAYNSVYIWHLWATKLLILVSRVTGYWCLSVFEITKQILIRKAQQWRIIGASFRLRTDITNLIGFTGKIYQLILQMKHLIDEKTSNTPKWGNL